MIEYPEQHLRESTPCILPKVNMLGLEEVHRLTGLTYDHLRKYCINGTYPHIKVGKKYLINYDKFLQILNGEQNGKQ